MKLAESCQLLADALDFDVVVVELLDVLFCGLIEAEAAFSARNHNVFQILPAAYNYFGMNDRPRPSDPRKLQQHNAGVFESVQSQEVAYVLNKIKRTVVKQHPPQSNHRPAEQLPER